jgi:hypothetical protein
MCSGGEENWYDHYWTSSLAQFESGASADFRFVAVDSDEKKSLQSRGAAKPA